MPSGLNAAALSPVNGTALLAAPGELSQCRDLFVHRVIDGNTEAMPVHPAHHAAEICSMIRAALQNIVLPLVNHFMRQRRDSLLVSVRSVSMQKDRGQFDAAPPAGIACFIRQSMSRPRSGDEQSCGRRESSAPFDANRRQHTTKKSTIEVGPDGQQRFARGQLGTHSSISMSSQGQTRRPTVSPCLGLLGPDGGLPSAAKTSRPARPQEVRQLRRRSIIPLATCLSCRLVPRARQRPTAAP